MTTLGPASSVTVPTPMDDQTIGSSSPIDQLSDDVLEYIFYLRAQEAFEEGCDNEQTLVTGVIMDMSQVNRRWRGVVLESSRLWAMLSISIPLTRQDRERLLIVVERVKASPVSLHIVTQEECTWKDMTDLPSQVAGLLQQSVLVDADLVSQELGYPLDFFDALASSMWLKTVSLSIVLPDDESWEYFESFLAAISPRIEVLELCGITTLRLSFNSAQERIDMPKLRSLSLSATPTELLLLFRAPALQLLTATDLQFDEIFGSNLRILTEEIHGPLFPLLQKVVLAKGLIERPDNHSIESVVSFLNTLPPLQQLFLHGIDAQSAAEDDSSDHSFSARLACVDNQTTIVLIPREGLDYSVIDMLDVLLGRDTMGNQHEGPVHVGLGAEGAEQKAQVEKWLHNRARRYFVH